MPLAYHPRPGDILLCHFPECFVVPEMVKCRPVVIVSSRLPGRAGLTCVVPLSSTAPQQPMRYHLELPIRCMPAVLQAKSSRVWAKCDMIYTLGLIRLDRFRAGRDRQTGKRIYQQGQVTADDLAEIRCRMAIVLDLNL